MAGGTWASQNKVLAGAYINVRSEAQLSQYDFSNSGRLAIATPLTWGAPISVITVDDLISGKSRDLIGVSMQDSVPLTVNLLMAFKGTKEIIVYRTDSGGNKATASLGTTNVLTVTAKYAGVAGNDIQVSTETAGGLTTVKTFFRSTLVDTQIVDTIDDLVDNAYVDFSGTGVAETVAAKSLTGGTNGTESTATVLSDLSAYHYDLIWLPSYSYATLEADVDALRDAGNKVKVLIEYAEATPMDNEAIIQYLPQTYYDENGSDVTEKVKYFLAGQLAGADMNESLTYRVVDFVKTVAAPINDADAINYSNNGVIIIRQRYNGDWVIEADINSLHTFTDEKAYYFAQNKIVRILDTIHNFVRETFEVKYISQPNNQAIRDVFKGDLVQYFNGLMQANIIEAFDSTNDILVFEGADKNSIRADVYVQPIGALEKLYMNIVVR